MSKRLYLPKNITIPANTVFETVNSDDQYSCNIIVPGSDSPIVVIISEETLRQLNLTTPQVAVW
jgi:hypothetical protein